MAVDRWFRFSAAFVLFFVQFISVQGFNRTLVTEILCPSEQCSKLRDIDSYINVAHTKADGEHDRLHYIYSTYGAPTVLVARTSLSSELKVNWTHFLSPNVTDVAQSLVFTNGTPNAVLALVFTKLIEFNDTNDSGILPKNKHLWRTYNLVNASWENSTAKSNVADNMVSFQMNLGENGSISENGNRGKNASSGSVIFTFQAFATDGMYSELPHLHYNANITQIYVTLDGLATKFSQPRFALEMVTVTLNTSKDENENMTILDIKSIDDETTPGAFHIINWARSSPDGVYLQWKPMCYTERSKSISNARYARHDALKETILDDDEAHLALAYFGNFKNVFFNVTHVSFGETDDKFYTATKYSTWALNVGYGTPPVESVSLLLIIIIIIGLGIPVLLILAGGIYIVVQKYRKKRPAGYEDLTSSYPPIGT